MSSALGPALVVLAAAGAGGAVAAAGWRVAPGRGGPPPRRRRPRARTRGRDHRPNPCARPRPGGVRQGRLPGPVRRRRPAHRRRARGRRHRRVRHGLEGKAGPGTITIIAADAGAEARISVEDDGVGMDPERVRKMLAGAADEEPGIGLGNVDERLRQVYGDGYGLVVETAPGAGTKVSMRV